MGLTLIPASSTELRAEKLGACSELIYMQLYSRSSFWILCVLTKYLVPTYWDGAIPTICIA